MFANNFILFFTMPIFFVSRLIVRCLGQGDVRDCPIDTRILSRLHGDRSDLHFRGLTCLHINVYVAIICMENLYIPM